MVEDSDDKTRRNLVAFSAVVLLIGWLDISPAEMLQKLLAPASPQTAEWRVWFACLVVLAYLALRFRFAVETQAELARARSELTGRFFAQVKRLFEDRLKHYMHEPGGAEAMFTEPLYASVEAHQQRLLYSRGETREALSPALSLASLNGGGGDWRHGTANVTITWEQVSAKDTIGLGYRIRGWPALKSSAQVLTWMALYSDGSVRVLAPWLLAWCATMVACFRLVESAI